MRFVTTIAVLLLLVSPALAKPPPTEDLPSLVAIRDRLDKEIAEAERARLEAARDPEKEFLRDYLMGVKNSQKDHERIVGIMDNRSLDRVKPTIRQDAAKALSERWKPREGVSTLKQRKDVSRLLYLLLSKRHDEKSNRLAIGVLRIYWGTDRGYKVDAGWRDKNKAINDWRRALK